MNTNKNITVKSEREAGDVIAMLRREGFTRVSNCFWYEDWKNENGDKVTVEREF